MKKKSLQSLESKICHKASFLTLLRIHWIYLIEAYHTSNPITAERKYELEQMMGECADKCIYITAFESNDAFRSCKEDLAWETEVWIVTNPDHMIHRNGFRFIGPYGKTTE